MQRNVWSGSVALCDGSVTSDAHSTRPCVRRGMGRELSEQLYFALFCFAVLKLARDIGS